MAKKKAEVSEVIDKNVICGETAKKTSKVATKKSDKKECKTSTKNTDEEKTQKLERDDISDDIKKMLSQSVEDIPEEERICVICNKRKAEKPDDVFLTFVRPDFQTVFVCEQCVGHINSFARLMLRRKSEKLYDEAMAMANPSDYFELLSDRVVGQDEAKKILASAMFMHKMRYLKKGMKMKKSNVILVGSSGTGKTLLAKTIAETLGLPFAMMDATSVTQAGFKGQDVENVLIDLMTAADGNKSRAMYGVVYIDEIDKLARRSSGNMDMRDPSGEGVQQALLKLVEGCDAELPIRGRGIPSKEPRPTLNTENILFICGGAFEGMLTETVSGGLGFNNELEDKVEGVEVTEDTLIQYGMMPELVGRFPIIARLNDLTENDLFRILTEPKDSLTDGYKEFFKELGTEVTFEEDGLREIARRAYARKTGARSLQSELEHVLRDAIYEVPDDDSIIEVVVNKEAVERGSAVYVRSEETAMSDASGF